MKHNLTKGQSQHVISKHSIVHFHFHLLSVYKDNVHERGAFFFFKSLLSRFVFFLNSPVSSDFFSKSFGMFLKQNPFNIVKIFIN